MKQVSESETECRINGELHAASQVRADNDNNETGLSFMLNCMQRHKSELTLTMMMTVQEESLHRV